MRSAATISDDGLYRYRLSRHWAETGDLMAFIMLNPSTADANVDDPTIRRCMGFARREGCAGIEVVNLYALRATQPAALLTVSDPEGPDNWLHWHRVLEDHRIAYIVAAWGSNAVRRNLPDSRALHQWNQSGWFCLGRTSAGLPRHPLYVRGDQELVAL